MLDDLSNGKRENVNSGATLVVADIRDEEAVGKAFADLRPEACLHLAAQADVRVSVLRPVFDAEVNVLGTIRLLEAAREHESRIVFASTGGAIYGECEEPATEESVRAPLSPYGASKLRRRGVPGDVQPPVRRRAHGSALRQRLRPSPGPPRGGRRGRHLPRAAGARRGAAHLRRRHPAARLRLRRRRRPGRARGPGAPGRRLQRRDRRGDVGSRPVRGVRNAAGVPTSRRSSTRRGSESSSAASSTRGSPNES